MRLLLTLFASTFFLCAEADEVTHKKAVEELLEVTDVEKMLGMMHGQLDQMFSSTIEQMDVPQKDKPIAEKYMKKMANLVEEEMSWGKMKEPFVEIYIKVYSEEEIREIIDFYRSPVGQKFLSKMPEVMQASMQVSQQLMRDFMPKMQELQRELAAEIERNKEGRQ